MDNVFVYISKNKCAYKTLYFLFLNVLCNLYEFIIRVFTFAHHVKDFPLYNI